MLDIVIFLNRCLRKMKVSNKIDDKKLQRYLKSLNLKSKIIYYIR